MDELLLPFLAFAGWCLGIAGYVKARRALAEVAALRAQIAGEPPPVAATEKLVLKRANAGAWVVTLIACAAFCALTVSVACGAGL